MACCNTDLGRVPHNEPIKLGIISEMVGKYIFRLNFLGSIIYQEQEIEDAGDELIVPGPFNENHTYQLTILNPDLEPVVNAENNNCDTWIFTTFIAIKQSCNGTNECDDVVDLNDYDYN